MSMTFPKTLTPLRVMRKSDAASALIAIGRKVDDYICKADSEENDAVASLLAEFADSGDLKGGCPVPSVEVELLLVGDCGKKLQDYARACLEGKKDIYPPYARYAPFVGKLREFGDWFPCASGWVEEVCDSIRDRFIMTDIEGFWLDRHSEFRVPLGYYEEWMHRGCVRDNDVPSDVASFLKEARGTWFYDPDAKESEGGDDFGAAVLDGVEIIGNDVALFSPKDAVGIAIRLVTECLDEDIDEEADTLYAVDYDKLAAEFPDDDERRYAEALAEEVGGFYSGRACAYIRWIRGYPKNTMEYSRYMSLSADVRGAIDGWAESGAAITPAIRPSLRALYPVSLFVADMMERVGVSDGDGEWYIGEGVSGE